MKLFKKTIPIIVFLHMSFILCQTLSAQRDKLNLGICEPNLVWQKKTEQKNTMDDIKKIGCKNLRTGVREKVEIAFDLAEYCNKITLPICLNIMPLDRHMVNGAKKRTELKELWNVYGLSSLDVKKFLSEFEKWNDFLIRKKINVESFEVFNEINWADFNGDLLGGGIYITEENSDSIPFFKNYLKGMKKYSEIIHGMRKILDKKFAFKKTQKPKLILGSFVKLDLNWLNKMNASVVQEEFHHKILAGKFEKAKDIKNVFDVVDGVAIHPYPNRKNVDFNNLDSINKTMREYIDPIYKYMDKNKEIHITEYSLSLYSYKDESNPQQARADDIIKLTNALASDRFSDVKWGAIQYYCYGPTDDKVQNLCLKLKNGTYTPIKKLFEK